MLLNRIENKRHRGTQISVILPAHNAEKTLRRAVESVLAAMKTVEEDAVIASRLQAEDSEKPLFEILIIENGSEDATEFTARRLEAESDGRVRLLKSEKGVSNARNRGLEEACGEWILFLDADDYLLEGAGAVLRDALHFTGTDLIVCSYEAGGQQIHLCPPGGERFAGEQVGDIIVRMIENPTRYTSVWTKLFRRDFIERQKLRFDPSLHYSTDTGSVVRTWDGTKEEGYKRSLCAVQDFLKTQPPAIRQAGAGYGMMQFNLLMVREVFSLSSPLSAGEKIRTMKRIAAEEPFASAIAAYDPQRHTGARYLPFRFLKRKMAAAAAGIYTARAIQNARREGRLL